MLLSGLVALVGIGFATCANFVQGQYAFGVLGLFTLWFNLDQLWYVVEEHNREEHD